MKPDERIEVRILASDIPKELKCEIINSLNWYRDTLYRVTKDNQRLKDDLSAERWKGAICTGSY